MTLKPGQSDLLDHRGVEAVKAAVKSHTLKERSGESGVRPHPSGTSESRLLGDMAPRKEPVGGGEGRGRRVGPMEEERPLGPRPAVW